MSDKILTEAFDKLKAIEESDDPFCIGDVNEEVVDEEEVIDEEVVDEEAEEEQLDESNGHGEEAVDELRMIQEDLFDVIERLDAAIRNYLPHKHSNLEAYLLARLKIRAGSDQYMSNDPSIDKVIEMVEEELGEYDDDMDEAVGGDLEGMQKQSQQQGDELDNLKSKLDHIKGRQGKPGYDDRSRRGVQRTRRR